MADADPDMVKRCLETVVDRLAEEPTPSRANVERGIILPILQALGWDVFDTNAVQSRFPAGGANFDLALCDGQGQPQLFLDIHGSRFDPGIVPGLLSRARRVGVGLVVLTNGAAWRLFLAETDVGSADPVFEFDPNEAEMSEFAPTLCRYLERQRVLSGASVKDAIGRNALPAAWRALVSQDDSLLVELLADEAQDRVGVRPDDRAVKTFLRELTHSPRPEPPPPGPPPPRNVRATVELRGVRRDFPFVKNALVFLLTKLSETDGMFLERCSRDPVFATKRSRHLARSPEDLFPTQPHLRKHHARLPGGWFLNTNTNTTKKEQEARAAADVAGLKFGTELIVHFRSP